MNRHIFAPELLLVILALSLLLGCYNGYKLSEYFRFRALNRELEQRRQAQGA
ncbi:MAG: 7TM domain-containing protein [Candidatus Competibacterales bacterium]